ncbi:cell wall hydrolase [Tuberibacillus sp. Marseille-P3662]|uniref:cell wall hydrolase n=1 Tax=Tuberibacillus sp. Marseille-P3662 TaxID=1965358 RepID=UPI000A1CF093|nr:cell wall hydrolase [Tuberibacillus sp. Marseille-P3662]
MKKIFAIIVAITLLIIPMQTMAYTVKGNDTLWEIAQDHHLSVDKLLNINPQIKNPNLIYPGQNIQLYAISEEEHRLLAKLVHAEARGEPFKGKVSVAAVVLNRVSSNEFPDNIHDVIYQDHQFTPVANGTLAQADPSDDDYKAVDQAIAKRGSGKGSLFFYNPDLADSQFLEGLTTTTVIGNHVFKK